MAIDLEDDPGATAWWMDLWLGNGTARDTDGSSEPTSTDSDATQVEHDPESVDASHTGTG